MHVRALVVAVLTFAMPLSLFAADTQPSRGNLPQAERWLTGHNNAIRAVAFSPDGKLLASAGAEVELRIWDISTGKCLQILPGHRDSIVAVAFSRDGKKVATGSWDTTAKIWNLATGALEADLAGHGSHVHAVAFSGDGKQLVTASCDHTVRTWDIASEKQLLLLERDYEVLSVDWSPDGKYLVIPGTRDPAAPSAKPVGVAVVDAATGEPVREFNGIPWFKSEVHIFDQGKKCFHIVNDSPITAWDIQTGDQLWQHKLLHNNNEFLGGISSDGSRFFAIADATLHVFDVQGRNEVLALQRTGFSVPSALSPDGRILAVAGGGTHSGGPLFHRPLSPGDDHAIRLYDIDLMKREILAQTPRTARSFVVSPAGNLVALDGDDAFIWDTARQSPMDTSKRLPFAAFSPDGSRIAMRNAKRVEILGNDCQLLSSMTLSDYLGALCFSPDNKQLIAAPRNSLGALMIVDLTTARITKRFGQLECVTAIACSPDAQRVITIGGKASATRSALDGSIELCVWEIATGQQLASHAFPAKTALPFQKWLALSPDARYAISGIAEKVRSLGSLSSTVLHDVTLFDIDTGKPLGPVSKDAAPKSVPAFTADGKHLIFCDSDWFLTVVSVPDLKVIWRGPQRRARSYSLSPDGQSIFVGCDDGTLRTYRLGK